MGIHARAVRWASLLVIAASPGCSGGGTTGVATASDAGSVALDANGTPPMTAADASPASPSDGAGSPPRGAMPTARWSTDYGDGNIEDATCVAIDASGNIVLTGYFQGTIDFGGGPLTAAGASNDIFVAKLDSSGHFIWAKQFGDTQSQAAYGVAVDLTGAVYVVGNNSGTLDFGTGAPLVSAGMEDVFIAKLDTNGAPIWSKGFGDPTDQSAFSVAVTPSGAIAVVGYMDGTVDFGGVSLTSAGNGDALAIELDATGATLWANRFGDAAEQEATNVAVDSTGALAIAGEFGGSITIGATTLASADMRDAFLAKLDPSGAPLFADGFGGPGDQLGDWVATGPNGAIVLGASFQNSITVGTTSITSLGTASKLVASFDATGTVSWTKAFASASVYDWSSVAVDAQGNVFVAGEFDDGIDLGFGRVETNGGYDVFVAKLDATGAPVWLGTYGDPDDQFARAVALDATGAPIVCGLYEGSIDFGPIEMIANGAMGDVFVVGFAP